MDFWLKICCSRSPFRFSPDRPGPGQNADMWGEIPVNPDSRQQSERAAVRSRQKCEQPMREGHITTRPITAVRVQKTPCSISCRRALDWLDVAVIKLCLWTEWIRDDFARIDRRLDNINLFPLIINMDHKKQIKMWIAAILGLFLVLDGEQKFQFQIPLSIRILYTTLCN